MNIFGRKDEIKILEEGYNSDAPELIAVYGRRRIGKTWLIREYFEEKDCVFFKTTGSISEKRMKIQIFNFLKDIERTFGKKEEEVFTEITHWAGAFNKLENKLDEMSNEKKIILFFDEIPWFDTAKSGFLTAFGHFWNNYVETSKKGHIKVVVCGSSTSWMIKNIVNEKGALHQRKTKNIPLEPFSLKETKGYLKYKNIELTNKSILNIFLAVGGVAKYLDKIPTGKTSVEIIDLLFFSKNAEFRTEFNTLYSATFQNHNLHLQIVKLLSNSMNGLTRSQLITASKNKIKSGESLSTALNELVAASFIKESKPFSIDIRIKGKNDIKYKLIDEYSLFYFKWLNESNIDFNAGGVTSYWNTVVTSNTYNNWIGHAFEAVCHKHVKEIKTKLSITDNVSPYWWRTEAEADGSYSGAEIDMIIQRHGKDKSVNICELKYYSSMYSLDKKQYDNLKNKITAFKEKNNFKDNIFVTLITAEGSTKNKYYNEIVHSQVSLIDLFDD